MTNLLARLDAVLADDTLVPVAGRAHQLDALLAELHPTMGADHAGWLDAFGGACLAVLRRGHPDRFETRPGWQRLLTEAGGTSDAAQRLQAAGLLVPVAHTAGLLDVRSPVLRAFAAGRAIVTTNDAAEDIDRRMWAGMDRAVGFAIAWAAVHAPDTDLSDRLAGVVDGLIEDNEVHLGLSGALIDHGLAEGARYDEGRLAGRFQWATQALADPEVGPRVLRRVARLLATLLRAGADETAMVRETTLELLGTALDEAADWDMPARTLLTACAAVADEVAGLASDVRRRLFAHKATPELVQFFDARLRDRSWPWPLPADQPWPFEVTLQPRTARMAELDALGQQLSATELTEVGPLAASYGALGRGFPWVGDVLRVLLLAAFDAPGGMAAMPGLLAGLGAVGLTDDETWARTNLAILVGTLADALHAMAADPEAIDVAEAALLALGRAVDDRRWHDVIGEDTSTAVAACLAMEPRLRFAAIETLTLWQRTPGGRSD
jgi:hypothetical protein